MGTATGTATATGLGESKVNGCQGGKASRYHSGGATAPPPAPLAACALPPDLMSALITKNKRP